MHFYVFFKNILFEERMIKLQIPCPCILHLSPQNYQENSKLHNFSTVDLLGISFTNFIQATNDADLLRLHKAK